jgi:hypothetical protein
MHTAQSQARRPVPAFSEFVNSDLSALASHMYACQRSHGRFFRVRSALERMHGVASPRIVTTAAVLAACALGLLAFA